METISWIFSDTMLAIQTRNAKRFPSPFPILPPLLCREQPRRVPVVQLKKKLDAAGFIGKWLWTVAQIDGPVQLLVRFYKRGTLIYLVAQVSGLRLVWKIARMSMVLLAASIV